MKLITKNITIKELEEMSQNFFSGLVKAVVDTEKEVMVVDAGLHADEEKYLIENGSKQDDLWGINLYPELGIDDEDFIEFDSMINIRPRLNNSTRSIDNKELQKKIIKIVKKLVAK